MGKERLHSVQNMLEQLTTKDLDEMLQDALDHKPVDADAVRRILRILWEREKDQPVMMTPQIASAWESYQRNISQLEEAEARRKKRRSRVIKLLSTAAVFAILVIFILPQRTQANSPWNRLARWTDEVLEFFTPEDNEDRLVDYEFKTDHPGLQQVHDAAAEIGVTVPAVPMWLPEEYELVECKTEYGYGFSNVYSRFSNGTDEVVISIDCYSEDILHKYEKDDSQLVQKELQGILFSIMRNYDKWVVVWSTENAECAIYIDCQEETLDRILNSVYMVEA